MLFITIAFGILFGIYTSKLERQSCCIPSSCNIKKISISSIKPTNQFCTVNTKESIIMGCEADISVLNGRLNNNESSCGVSQPGCLNPDATFKNINIAITVLMCFYSLIFFLLGSATWDRRDFDQNMSFIYILVYTILIFSFSCMVMSAVNAEKINGNSNREYIISSDKAKYEQYSSETCSGTSDLIMFQFCGKLTNEIPNKVTLINNIVDFPIIAVISVNTSNIIFAIFQLVVISVLKKENQTDDNMHLIINNVNLRIV
jgi:hypothetical protein